MVKFYSNEVLVPEGVEIIRDNVDYFNRVTINLLDDKVDSLLKNTDACTYIDTYRFKDKYGYDLPWRFLSTGGMTVLNGYYSPDKVFSGIECGANAMTDMGLLDRGQFCDAFPWGDENTTYDVDVDGQVYKTFKEAYVNA